MKKGRLQAKDIHDALALEAVLDAMHHEPVILVMGEIVVTHEPWFGPAAMSGIVSHLLYPYRVVAAKVDSLVRRGLLEDHGSLYSLTKAGESVLAEAKHVATELKGFRYLAKDFYPSE